MSWTPHYKDDLESTIADRLIELAEDDAAYGELVVSEIRRLPEVGATRAIWDIDISGGTEELRDKFRVDLDGFRRRTELL